MYICFSFYILLCQYCAITSQPRWPDVTGPPMIHIVYSFLGLASLKLSLTVTYWFLYPVPVVLLGDAVALYWRVTVDIIRCKKKPIKFDS